MSQPIEVEKFSEYAAGVAQRLASGSMTDTMAACGRILEKSSIRKARGKPLATPRANAAVKDSGEFGGDESSAATPNGAEQLARFAARSLEMKLALPGPTEGQLTNCGELVADKGKTWF